MVPVTSVRVVKGEARHQQAWNSCEYGIIAILISHFRIMRVSSLEFGLRISKLPKWTITTSRPATPYIQSYQYGDTNVCACHRNRYCNKNGIITKMVKRNEKSPLHGIIAKMAKSFHRNMILEFVIIPSHKSFRERWARLSEIHGDHVVGVMISP